MAYYDHDPLTEKLAEKERAEEDIYFSRRDRELIARLHAAKVEAELEELRELVRMRCPECAARLSQVRRHGVVIEECRFGHGMWMTQAEMEALARRERDSWIGRVIYAARR